MIRSIVNFDPAEEVRNFVETFDRLVGSRLSSESGDARLLPIDVVETVGKWIVRAAVPGVSTEDLDVNIENNVLTIKGQSKQFDEFREGKIYRRELVLGSFSRSIRLPSNVDIDQVEAEFENGIVTISLPKVAEAKPIPVKVPIKQMEARTSEADSEG
ncbi:MAG: Spore protein SP21 [Fimbriimonadaceae bacterium]|nr:Spore protein SP21 [Fimbriimonadaceae bacterium]